ncbi:related to cel1 protein precursor [Phialocephala subalpina]|uniref:AA9 family lytic polysaccharide monooxygenase n=1 Tax=Phialocephala subalpina TaxID=576137 RepID=A0A1L7WK29_9HELO|nr:related to cel1 protein precursor [Phialocephala subalpina]
MMKLQVAIPFATVLSLASSHTIFTQLQAGSTTSAVGVGIRDPSYDGPISDVTSNDIACNGGKNPTTATNAIIQVQAGSTVKAIWRHTLTSAASDVIDPSHKGPVMAYLKKVTNAVTDPGYGAGWFKIQEAGLTNIANKGEQSITIPSCIVPGQYLLRAELIALHGAGSSQGAQFYMECAQVNITGGTGAKSPATVSLPGAYKASDPGILINIYQTLKGYTVPGPAVFTC